jgi:hypothetical protein
MAWRPLSPLCLYNFSLSSPLHRDSPTKPFYLLSLSLYCFLFAVPKSQKQQQIQYILGSIASHISHPKPSNHTRPHGHQVTQAKRREGEEEDEREQQMLLITQSINQVASSSPAIACRLSTHVHRHHARPCLFVRCRVKSS